MPKFKFKKIFFVESREGAQLSVNLARQPFSNTNQEMILIVSPLSHLTIPLLWKFI